VLSLVFIRSSARPRSYPGLRGERYGGISSMLAVGELLTSAPGVLARSQCFSASVFHEVRAPGQGSEELKCGLRFYREVDALPSTVRPSKRFSFFWKVRDIPE